MAPTSDVDVRVGLSSPSSTLSITRGETLTFDPTDWSTPKPVTLSSARDADMLDEFVSLAVSTTGMPTETVRVRITDEYESAEPPPGGAGGEAGTTGESGEGGLGGIAGEGPGEAGSDTGGSGPGSGGSDRGGSGAEGGQAEGGDGNDPEPTRGDESDGGCGCTTSRRSGGGVALLVLAFSLLRRRRARSSRRA
jgi:MYXO-CTERM domain-containing protein